MLNSVKDLIQLTERNTFVAIYMIHYIIVVK